MSILFLLNRQPYDSTDVTWNALRLATKLKEMGNEIRIFLMNDSVDLARKTCVPPMGYDQDLKAMLKARIESGVNKSTMAKLAEWVVSSEKVLTF